MDQLNTHNSHRHCWKWYLVEKKFSLAKKVLFVVVLMAGIIVTASAQTKDSIVNDSTAIKKFKPAPEALKNIVEQLMNSKKKTKSDAEIEMEINELIVDETKTKAGRDFYEKFITDWSTPNKERSYTITITEKPYRASTTQLQITINDTKVFESMLQSRSAVIEALCQQAMGRCAQFIANYDAIMKMLGNEDQIGNGIF
ncbi:hypothetical protein EYV94_06470 [Puteibacter caeruleilacunae]|nr:hypothetical protein EYV94_06470 [Puteibacter caeruleilacunae]